MRGAVLGKREHCARLFFWAPWIAQRRLTLVEMEMRGGDSLVGPGASWRKLCKVKSWVITRAGEVVMITCNGFAVDRTGRTPLADGRGRHNLEIR